MNLQHIAEQALAALKNEGADASQATVSTSALTELNITHSEPSLLRSTQSHNRFVRFVAREPDRRRPCITR